MKRAKSYEITSDAQLHNLYIEARNHADIRYLKVNAILPYTSQMSASTFNVEEAVYRDMAMSLSRAIIETTKPNITYQGNEIQASLELSTTEYPQILMMLQYAYNRGKMDALAAPRNNYESL